MTDFIGVYEGVFGDDFCNKAVSQFDCAIDQGFGWTRQDSEGSSKLHKNDISYWSAETDISSLSVTIGKEFSRVFWDRCYEDYASKYDTLNHIGRHTIYGNKIQKTKVGEGYHVWHCEQGNLESSKRILFYIVYLNDVEEGGETEFLYQHKRVKPTRGTVVIAPASFTHTHRGNPPLSNDKYILTGWIEF